MNTIRKILVVDDSNSDRAMIGNLLTEAGFDIETAVSGNDALSKLERQKPDLIFMDIVMPDMDGFHACREITHNEQTRDIPVVFVSSKSQEVDKVWGQLQGAKGYVTKPYTRTQILGEIERITQL